MMIKGLLCVISILNVSHSLIINKCVRNGDVALTFEDGPSIKSTKKLLNLLEAFNVKATFHVVTKHFNYQEAKNLMIEIISRDHVLGYRLEAEWTMQDVSTEGIQGAVDYRLEMIRKACGKKPKFVRTSFNATELVKNALLASGLIVTVPNFESYDYKEGFDINEMINRFDSLSLGSVISVQREFAANLFETTSAFVNHLRNKNYNIVTLQECTGIDEIYFNEKPISTVKIQDNNGESEKIDTTSVSASFAQITMKLSTICAIFMTIPLIAIIL